MPDDLVYRVRTATTGWTGAPGLNTFYFGQNLTVDPDEGAMAADCVARVHAFWLACVTAFPTAWVASVSPVVDVINTDNGDLVSSIIVTTPADVTGTSSAGFGPQVAMVVGSLLTSGIIDGRRVRGRAFLGPVMMSGDTDGSPLAAVVALFLAQLGTLLGGTTGHPPLVVWSRRRGVSAAHPTGLGGSAHIANGVTVRDTYAVLRSRRG